MLGFTNNYSGIYVAHKAWLASLKENECSNFSCLWFSKGQWRRLLHLKIGISLFTIYWHLLSLAEPTKEQFSFFRVLRLIEMA